MPDRIAGLRAAVEHAEAFLATLDERPVAARADAAGVRSSLGGPLPEFGEDPATVIDALATGAEPGLVATAGPGLGTSSASAARRLAADWLVSGDENAASMPPPAAAVSGDHSGWTIELPGLPETASVGFVCRWPGRQHHMPGRRAARRPGPCALGCRARRADWRTRGPHPVW
jgi:hypothetical protein